MKNYLKYPLLRWAWTHPLLTDTLKLYNVCVRQEEEGERNTSFIVLWWRTVERCESKIVASPSAFVLAKMMSVCRFVTGLSKFNTRNYVESSMERIVLIYDTFIIFRTSACEWFWPTKEVLRVFITLRLPKCRKNWRKARGLVHLANYVPYRYYDVRLDTIN